MTKEKESKSAKEQMLLEAARLGQLKQLESILGQFCQLKSKKRANPLASLRKPAGPNSIRDPVTGFTCLHHAALNGHADCVRLILNSGAKINTVDYKGSSALHLAAWAGNLQVVNVLLTHQAHLPLSQPASSSLSAISHQPQQHVTESRQDSPTAGKRPDNLEPNQAQHQPSNSRLDIDLCNTDNQTPLSLAAQFGHAEVVSRLLSHGANVHLRNNQLESALDLACLNGRLETVDLLLKWSPRLVFELRRPHSLLPAAVCQPAHLGHLSPVVGPQADGQQEAVGHTARRASSGGWPSRLLKGKSVEQHQGSPLQRLTAATLSMRQRSLKQEPQVQQQVSASASPAERRATLTSGLLGLSARPSAAGAGLDEPEEALLDHSPLHYAVRRNHLNVVNLLLCNYRANLLQVTSLGGLLHEVALNQSLPASKRSDMIGLLFDYVGFSGSQDPLDELQAFLNLKDAHQKSVFQVLASINNRTAQETTRLIHELSDRRHQQLSGRPLANPQQQYLPLGSFSNNQILVSNKQQQFGDIHSFVTMKRVPKQHRAPLDSFGCNNYVAHPQATQTIDRQAFQHPAQSGFARLRSMEVVQCPWPQSAQLNQQQQHQLITRSVSNLVSPLVDQQQQHYYPRQPAMMVDPINGSGLEQVGPRRAFDGGHLYDNKSPAHQLVRSQTDCTYLVSGGHPQVENYDAQGRKTINRHYHVYDHEFYPPRLVARQTAVVPPLMSSQPTSCQARHDAARASIRSTSSSQSANKCPVPRVGQQEEEEWSEQVAACNQLAQSHNNSRLSLNIEPQSARLARCVSQQAEPSSQPMDRFLNRHSRKLAAMEQQQQLEASKQNRQDLIDLQRRLTTGDQVAGQEQQIHASLSLESHLSEPHLFESTRKALMRDFDQMIGRELLNRDHRRIIEGRLASDDTTSSNGSQSILTGVMLDMDRYGEQLTVSGTRITLPAAKGAESAPRSFESAPQAQGRQKTASCSSRSSLSSGTRDSLASSVSPKSRDEQPPAKPPRPSLLKAQRASPVVQKLLTSQQMSGHLEQAVIYDLPASKPDQQRPEATMSCSHSAPAHKAPTRAALTEPPSEKPPPPPVASELACPLHVVAPATGGASGHSSSSSNTELGLLKTAQPSSPGGRNNLAEKAALGKRLHKKAGSTDADSGVCTSNSPASMSHDSESNATCLEGSMKPAGELEMLSLSIPSEPLPSEAPPSPNTAQLCIEEALMPLTKSEQVETMSQSTSPAPGATGRLLAVDRWLHVSDQESGYENCHALQQELERRKQTADQSPGGWSQDDLVARLNAVIGDAGQPESASLLEAEEDDDDYAASSSSDDHLTERDNSDHSSYTNNNAECRDSLEQTSSDGGRARELHLKVVVAEQPSDESSDGDQVFYIDPSELKRLSMKRSKANAESLTDEELCAAIDKSSGHIRFTLRKRRNNQQEEPPAAAHQQQVAGDLNNNPANKQAHDQLSQWFSCNLSGLAEYSAKLAANGFDELHLLNHSRLLNDETLKTIGIHDPTHRTLILESISRSLPPVRLDGPAASAAELLAALRLPEIPADQLNEEFLQAKADSLPLGHRLRLQLALEHLASGKAKSLSKQGSSDSELEASQASSSSKESIKSIVSCKVPTVQPDDGETTKHSVVEAPTARKESPLLKTRSGSLVSEAARRLEAAQKSTAGELPPRPVAAVRKMIVRPALADRSNMEEAEKPASKSQKSPMKRGPEFVPVRSVCWPPPPKADRPSQLESAGRPSGKPSPPVKPANLVVRRFMNQ